MNSGCPARIRASDGRGGVSTSEAASWAGRCRFVLYTLYARPRHYVDTVCERAGLTPAPGRVERAVGNIVPGLHRYRESAPPAGYRRIHDGLPAGSVFESLSRHGDIGAWPESLRLWER